MEVHERIVPRRILIAPGRRLSLVHRVERRMSARRRHILHGSPPGELARSQLAGNGLPFAWEHASLSNGLAIDIHLDRRAWNEVLVDLTIALSDGVGRLPTYQRDIVRQAVVADRVVIRQ